MRCRALAGLHPAFSSFACAVGATQRASGDALPNFLNGQARLRNALHVLAVHTRFLARHTHGFFRDSGVVANGAEAVALRRFIALLCVLETGIRAGFVIVGCV